MALNKVIHKGIIQSIVGNGYYLTSKNINITKSYFYYLMNLMLLKKTCITHFKVKFKRLAQII